MPKFLEFTASDSNPHVRITYGSAVHDGKVPRARHDISSVRIDGEPITFLDETIPDRLHSALLIGKEVVKKRAMFDCLVFAALMQGLKIGEPHSDGSFLTIGRTSLKREIDNTDTTVDAALNLGRTSRGSVNGAVYIHTVSPAHTIEGARYLHKLGDTGPVCFSELSIAMQIFRCTLAHPALLEPSS